MTCLKLSTSWSSVDVLLAAAVRGCGMITLESKSTPSEMVGVSFDAQRTKEKKTFQSSLVLKLVSSEKWAKLRQIFDIPGKYFANSNGQFLARLL